MIDWKYSIHTAIQETERLREENQRLRRLLGWANKWLVKIIQEYGWVDVPDQKLAMLLEEIAKELGNENS